MTEAFVKVGVQVVGYKQVFVEQLTGRGINHEFLIETVAVGSIVVSLGDVLDCHRFRAMGGTNPVCIRQVDADRCRGICITGKDCCIYHFRAHTLHFRLAEAGIDWRMILEPLRTV